MIDHVAAPTFREGERVRYTPEGWPGHDGHAATVVKDSYWRRVIRGGVLMTIERVRVRWTEEFYGSLETRAATVDVWHVTRTPA